MDDDDNSSYNDDSNSSTGLSYTWIGLIVVILIGAGVGIYFAVEHTSSQKHGPGGATPPSIPTNHNPVNPEPPAKPPENNTKPIIPVTPATPTQPPADPSVPIIPTKPITSSKHTVVFKANAEWTVPPNVTKIEVSAIGGGGSGGSGGSGGNAGGSWDTCVSTPSSDSKIYTQGGSGSSGGNGSAGGGGGSGKFVVNQQVDFKIGEKWNIIIGSGGQPSEEKAATSTTFAENGTITGALCNTFNPIRQAQRGTSGNDGFVGEGGASTSIISPTTTLTVAGGQPGKPGQGGSAGQGGFGPNYNGGDAALSKAGGEGGEGGRNGNPGASSKNSASGNGGGKVEYFPPLAGQGAAYLYVSQGNPGRNGDPSGKKLTRPQLYVSSVIVDRSTAPKGGTGGSSNEDVFSGAGDGGAGGDGGFGADARVPQLNTPFKAGTATTGTSGKAGKDGMVIVSYWLGSS